MSAVVRVVVAAPPAVREPADLAALPPSADLVELRLDLLPGTDTAGGLAAWIAASPRPVLATVRSRAEGGAFDGGAASAARRLHLAAEAGAAWVDVEGPVAPHVGRLPDGVEVLVSHHGRGRIDWPREVGGRTVRHRKLARPVEGRADLEALRAEAGDPANDGVSLVPYGSLGALRAVPARRGGLCFGSAGPDAGVVAGQPALVDLIDDLRAGEVGPDAELFGLLGRPARRSPSPALHNAVFRALRREAIYVPLPALDVDTALDLPFGGYSVTTPFKTRALEAAHEASPAARAIGAANTLVRTAEGGWRATNTDAEAVEEIVGPAPTGAGAFVYGAGGFARAAVAALLAQGYDVRVGARRAEAAQEVARALGARPAGSVYERVAHDAWLVNATPAGGDGVEPVFAGDAGLEGLCVLDAPYADPGGETGLVARARREGAARVVDGRALLVAQARGQVRAFTGQEGDPRVLGLAAAAPPCLVLLGLRGAGKTSVGREVARRLGRPFVDLDEEVERITGHAPGWWIRERGVQAFREREADASERLVGRRGVVVATGGGVLEHGRSRAAIARTGVAVLLEVAPGIAAARVAGDPRDRPALVDTGDPVVEARTLRARRAPAWRALAQAVFDANREVAVVAGEVAEWYAATFAGPRARAP